MKNLRGRAALRGFPLDDDCKKIGGHCFSMAPVWDMNSTKGQYIK